MPTDPLGSAQLLLQLTECLGKWLDFLLCLSNGLETITSCSLGFFFVSPTSTCFLRLFLLFFSEKIGVESHEFFDLFGHLSSLYEVLFVI